MFAVLERWLGEPEPPEPHLQPVLYAKVVIALLSDRPAVVYLDAQRAAHMARMQELTAMRRRGPLSQTLLADYGLFHLEADLRWIDVTAARLDQLAWEVKPAHTPSPPPTRYPTTSTRALAAIHNRAGRTHQVEPAQVRMWRSG